MDVSIIIPIYNGSKWIDQCFDSISNQSAIGSVNLEICVCNDASTDNTAEFLEKWSEILLGKGITVNVYKNDTSTAKGVGYAKNRAIDLSKGTYLCFQDVDDVMMPDRILSQYNKAKSLPNNYIVGSKFTRNPTDSTVRYTKWANNLSKKELNNQVFTSHGPTVIMPSWFCHSDVVKNVGGFSESGKGTPEDLIFFYKHLDLNGRVCRVDEVLLEYTYHPEAATFSIHENTIWDIRIQRLENRVLCNWTSFTIWNAGKQGRKLYNSLSPVNKNKVLALCDVDVKKIGRKYKPYDVKLRKENNNIDIVHYKDAKGPFVVCVKMDMTNGVFEKNLKSLKLEENKDYIIFS